MNEMQKFISICLKSQAELKAYLQTQLMAFGYEPIDEDGYLYAQGGFPVLLVAHMDTVHKSPPRTIWTTLEGDMVKANEGIGGDDRCGVYMILEILKRFERKPHVLFTEDEEIGLVGAREFAESGIKPDVNFIIELDRKGSDDCVFYDCDNEKFTDFIEGFGYKTAWGSCSDISAISEPLGVASVNLSSGYWLQHTTSEYVSLRVMENNILRVIEILASQIDNPQKFEYVKKKYSYEYYDYTYYGKGRTYGKSTKSSKTKKGKKGEVAEYGN